VARDTGVLLASLVVLTFGKRDKFFVFLAGEGLLRAAGHIQVFFGSEDA